MLLCGMGLAGCGLDDPLTGPRGAFAVLDLPETPDLADQPWPRLADVPDMPPPGEVGPGAPDPANGAEIAQSLQLEAAVAAARAETLGEPVIAPAEAARLRSASRRAAAAGGGAMSAEDAARLREAGRAAVAD
ncbi:hypothetical protein P2H44_20315 [Albimonas sp. CAU 1670]|uniref:hypothetical protein n=1 Tax=Albimonas sp. CAU 1670 TaxID=3032599 RepID=UPI0023DCEB0B|nr:hypothetical protein [Albimonas sp. CAU 1670]MDF2234911.1 hypothetical protein [Albimonas sp. CAU 1670]